MKEMIFKIRFIIVAKIFSFLNLVPFSYSMKMNDFISY